MSSQVRKGNYLTKDLKSPKTENWILIQIVFIMLESILSFLREHIWDFQKNNSYEYSLRLQATTRGIFKLQKNMFSAKTINSIK